MRREMKKMKDKNKIFKRLVIFAIAAITCLATLELVPTASAIDIYVPGDYATIQQAVNAANPGDTIIVAADTYGEMILINKPLTLRGANAGIHPTVGVHPNETVGARGPESILSHNGLYAIRPSADNITIDGFKFTGTGGQIIDTSNDANNFSLLNCIFDNPGDFGNKGNIQFGAGSHNDLLLAYNIFINGGDHTFYAGGGPFDRMHIIGNKFNSKGTAIFWAATPLVDAIVEYNEFDGAYNSVPGTGGARMNIGKGGNIIIRNNWFHDLYASGSQVGIIDGQVTDNIFENIYPHLTANFGSCFELWGGQWGTTISSNVTIERNDFYYNNVTGATAPTHGLRLRAPESGSGINGSTIHVHNNNFYDGSIRTDAHALWHQASDTVDGLCNWWSNTTGPYDLNGSVDYDPWLDAPYPYGNCGCNFPPTKANENPSNGSTNIDLISKLIITVDDINGDELAAHWYSNSSGSWVLFATNTSIDTSSGPVIINQTNANFSEFSTTYYWSINLTDGQYWTNATYHFTTRDLISWYEMQPLGDSNREWNTMATNSQGNYIIVTRSDSSYGRVFISSDYGATWTETQPAGDIGAWWTDVAFNADGNVIIVGRGSTPGNLYVSLDYGVTWNVTKPAGDVNRWWTAVASNAEGNGLIAGVSSDTNGRLYTSSDYGETWTERQPAGEVNRRWESLSSNAEGNVLIAGINSDTNGRLYTSSDYGETWTERQPAGDVNRRWRRVASNAEGNILVAGADGSNGRLYISYDYGETWMERQPAGDVNRGWMAVASNGEGNILMAGVWNGHFYTSFDYGETWSEVQPKGNINGNWHTAALNNRGNYLFAGEYAGRLYRGRIPPPRIPTSFTTTTHNHKQINVTWTKGIQATHTLIEWNSTATWNRGEGNEIYNNIGKSYQHTDLDPDTTYYYQAWSFNNTTGLWNETCISDSATTDSVVTPSESIRPKPSIPPPPTSIILLNQLFGLNLTLPFQAKDTTGDGNIDSFIDPNNMIYLIRSATLDGNIIFLLAIQQGDMPDFFWDPKTDEITLVTSSEVKLSEPIVDEKAQEITFSIPVEKSDWIYIKIVDPYPHDEYPNFTFKVTTADGRVIPSDWIWRENGFIYMLDDPDVTYLFIYGYDELPADLIPPTPDEPEKIGIPIWIYIIGLIILIILILAAILKTDIFKKKEEKKTK